MGTREAIELALENNTDIMIQRYYPSIADIDLVRTAAGSNARGVGNVTTPGFFGNAGNKLTRLIATGISW